jgi:hypothetical protein
MKPWYVNVRVHTRRTNLPAYVTGEQGWSQRSVDLAFRYQARELFAKLADLNVFELNRWATTTPANPARALMVPEDTVPADRVIDRVEIEWGTSRKRHGATVVSPSLVGRTYRPDVGGSPLTVVAEDDRFVYVKRADDSKRALANPNGAQITTRAEIAAWTLLTEGSR